MTKVMHKHPKIQSHEGLADLNTIMLELAKPNPNREKLKQLSSKYGIACSNDPKIFINELICFLDQQRFAHIPDREL